VSTKTHRSQRIRLDIFEKKRGIPAKPAGTGEIQKRDPPGSGTNLRRRSRKEAPRKIGIEKGKKLVPDGRIDGPQDLKREATDGPGHQQPKIRTQSMRQSGHKQKGA